jgi:3-deoxy-D-manno-oct-2-ulosonic acid (Kdo) hydroxylase
MVMQVLETFGVNDWSGAIDASTRARAIHALESGKVLFFPKLRFTPTEAEREFFSPAIADPKTKNITLDPATGLAHGTSLSGAPKARLEAFMARFAQDARALTLELLPAYAAHLEIARTTFRPVEIEHRSYSPKKDDRLLHVDAFPSRPTGGKRILRVFANVNPNGAPRVWRVGEPFEAFASQFMPRVARPSGAHAFALAALGITKGKRSPYDQLMLELHDAGKLDARYQQSAPQEEIAFPAGSAWICFTDQVLHAALGGQYAFEQTFHLAAAAMSEPALMPKAVLERLAGRALA